MGNRVRLALLSFVASLIYGQTPDPEVSLNVMCIRKLTLPAYPPLAQQARIQGTVSVNVKLSSEAVVREVEFQDEVKPSMPGAGILLKAVSEAVQAAAFEPNCANRTVSLVFIFQLDGTSNGRPRQTVEFGAPNRFWIRSEAPHW